MNERRLSVILPTHNPNPSRLRRTLAGLRAQTLPAAHWETLLVDNASTPAVVLETLGRDAPTNLRLLGESTLGLTSARRRGLREATAPFTVFVDDDNVLAPDYLEKVLLLFLAHPGVGALGGRSLPEFEQAPPEWTREFFDLLALRDPGPAPLISAGLRPPNSPRNEYPPFAPIGAGMALRRTAVQGWLEKTNGGLSDRRGSELSSAGDNDIVFSVLRADWAVAYFPELLLTHLIPGSRLEPGYLARLNRGVQKSWMQVLTQHDANPWPPLSSPGARVRQWKSWLVHQPWRSPARAVRWQGACGHFEGRVQA